jgi:hypothetical protein
MAQGRIPTPHNRPHRHGQKLHSFKKPDQIPFSLIAELAKRMSVEEFVGVYEWALIKK